MPTVDLRKLLFARRRLKKPAAIVASLILIFLGYEKLPLLDEPITGIAAVIDGDTIEIHGQRIRLFGIDAPESRQLCKKDGQDYRCGQEATFALTEMIGQQPVTCDKKDTDRYNRIVAICTAGQTEINRQMVATGHALAYRQYSNRYVEDEREAKAARRGLWGGRVEKPWDYRHRQPRASRRTPAPSDKRKGLCARPLTIS